MDPLPTWKLVVQLIAVPLLLAYCLWRGRNDLRHIAACIVILTLYGMIQDQISARLCPEYFTVAHQPIPGLTEPTLLGVAWGFLGAWWGGMLLGMALGLTTTLGSRPPLTVRDTLPGMGCLILGVAAVSLIAGMAAYTTGDLTGIQLAEPWASAIPAERHLSFLVVACAHFGTYTSAILGSGVLCVWAARLRRRKAAVLRCGGDR